MKSIRQLSLIISGTQIERLAIDVAKVNSPTIFIEPNGDEYSLTSTGWVQTKVAGLARAILFDSSGSEITNFGSTRSPYSLWLIGNASNFENATDGVQGSWLDMTMLDRDTVTLLIDSAGTGSFDISLALSHDGITTDYTTGVLQSVTVGTEEFIDFQADAVPYGHYMKLVVSSSTLSPTFKVLAMAQGDEI